MWRPIRARHLGPLSPRDARLPENSCGARARHETEYATQHTRSSAHCATLAMRLHDVGQVTFILFSAAASLMFGMCSGRTDSHNSGPASDGASPRSRVWLPSARDASKNAKPVVLTLGARERRSCPATPRAHTTPFNSGPVGLGGPRGTPCARSLAPPRPSCLRHPCGLAHRGLPAFSASATPRRRSGAGLNSLRRQTSSPSGSA
eukprot:10841308-Alexandrium_andersonii.AAC.1